jgi:hypothetical protein
MSVTSSTTECEPNIHATNGLHLPFVTHPRWGDFYNLLGDGAGGRLAWVHTQEGQRPPFYAISFRPLPPGHVPDRLPPRGFVGDGSHRCQPVGASTTDMIHSRVTAADLDDDGWIDITASAADRTIAWFRNRGGRDLEEARPIPVPAVPSDPDVAVTDCNGDGDADLIAGTAYGYFRWFERTFLKRGYAHAEWVRAPGVSARRKPNIGLNPLDRNGPTFRETRLTRPLVDRTLGMRFLPGAAPPPSPS